jgi:hypothetical protein
MRLYSSKSLQQPIEPQEALYICFLPFKCVCRFVSGWISFLPSSRGCQWFTFLILGFSLFEAQKCWQNQTPPIYIPQVLSEDLLSNYQTVLTNNLFYHFFYLNFDLEVCTMYVQRGAGTKYLLSTIFLKRVILSASVFVYSICHTAHNNIALYRA